MKIAMLYVVGCICCLSVQSYYLDQSKSDDWYQVLENRNLETLNDDDEDIIATAKRFYQIFEIEAPYKYVASSEGDKCLIVDDHFNNGRLCRADHQNGSVCKPSNKIQCTTIIIEGEKSRCKCELLDHIDRCGRDIPDDGKY